MSNGTDDQYRSRKWTLAMLAFRTATLLMLLGWALASYTLSRGYIVGAEWIVVLKGGWTFWWLTVGTTLTGYGFANVAQKHVEAQANENGGE